MSIQDWPEDERPREKLIKQGAHSLSDAELLAVFLRVGTRGKSAVDLARDMIQHFGSLRELFAASLSAFSQLNGLGSAKYAQLHAVLELAKRAINEELQSTPQFQSSAAVKDYLRLHFATHTHESFTVLFLNTQNQLIRAQEMFNGTLTEARVYPREIMKAALHHHAAHVILAHNHPSGLAQASNADIALTHELQAALRFIDVPILDHLIVAGSHVYSLAEHGQMK